MFAPTVHWARGRLHALFEATLVIKGVLAAAELGAGLALWFVGNAQVAHLVHWLTVHEVAEDPHDPVLRWSVDVLQGFPVETQHFFAIYLCLHGLLKLGLVTLLARRVRWAYPAGIALLAGFVVWQMVQWAHSPDVFLIAVSALDCLMIGLIAREWRAMRRGIVL